MSETPVALAFVDRERGLYVTARKDFALVFEEAKASSYDEPLDVSATEGGWTARVPGGLSLELARVGDAVELGGIRASLPAGGGWASARRARSGSCT